MIVARLAPAHRTAVNEQTTVRAPSPWSGLTYTRRYTARCFDGCGVLSHPLPSRDEAALVARRHETSQPDAWIITTLG